MPPPNPTNDAEKEDTSAPSDPATAVAPAADTPAMTEDAKMEETKTVEDTFDDIPETVIKVSLGSTGGETVLRLGSRIRKRSRCRHG